MFRKIFFVFATTVIFSFVGTQSVNAETESNVPDTNEVSPQLEITVTGIPRRSVAPPVQSIPYEEIHNGVAYAGTIYLERYYMDPDVGMYFAYYGGTLQMVN